MKKLLLLLSVLFVVSCSPEPILYMLTSSVSPVDTGMVIPSTRQYNEGDTATLTATPAAEYVFDKWTGAEGGSETTIVMSSDKTVVANFIKKKYALTVNISGEGTVTEKIIKAGAATDYNSGTIVELTATPSTGWSFVKWDGDLTGSENPIEITIDKAQTLTAVFEQNLFEFLQGKKLKSREWVTLSNQFSQDGIAYMEIFEDVSSSWEGWYMYVKADIDNICNLYREYTEANLAMEFYDNSPLIFRINGVYGQSWLFTKTSDNKILIQYGGYSYSSPITYTYDEGSKFELMSEEEFNKLDCK